jgi:mannitol/fructose-specific phosphotransferase system IIA component (Ntr-type)
MNLLDYTMDSGFLPHIKCDTMHESVSRLVDSLAQAGAVADASHLLDEIMRREEEGSTAIGGGLVIPHARYAGVQKVHLAVATLSQPVDIPSEDNRPVDVVILLVGPDRDPRQMLRVLARLARLVKQGEFLDSLRSARSAEDLKLAFGQLGGSSA